VGGLYFPTFHAIYLLLEKSAVWREPISPASQRGDPTPSTSVRRWVIRWLDDSPGGERIQEVHGCPASTLLTLGGFFVGLLAGSQKDTVVVRLVFVIRVYRAGD
jgi:hypothetical protein